MQVLMKDTGPVLRSEAKSHTQALWGLHDTCVSEDPSGYAWLLMTLDIFPVTKD